MLSILLADLYKDSQLDVLDVMTINMIRSRQKTIMLFTESFKALSGHSQEEKSRKDLLISHR